MIGEKSGKALKDSAVHTTFHNVSGKEPLVERVKRRTRGLAKKAMFAGLVGLSALMFRPATLTAQQITMNAPTGKIAEQTTKTGIGEVKKDTTKISYYFDFATMADSLTLTKKGDDMDVMSNILFDAISQGKSNVHFSSDGIFKIFDGVVNGVASKYESCKDYFIKKGVDPSAYDPAVNAGNIKVLYTTFQEVKNFGMYTIFANWNNIKSSNKSDNTEIIIQFDDPYGLNKTFFFNTKFPKSYNIRDITPFLGTVSNNAIEFGLYINYTKNGEKYEMIRYISYPQGKPARTIYLERKSNDISCFVEQYAML